MERKAQHREDHSVFGITRLNEFHEDQWSGLSCFAGTVPKKATVEQEAEMGTWSGKD